MKNLTKREKLFCQMYATCRNGREAAYRSGYTVCPEIRAKYLLSEKRIRDEIEKTEKEAGDISGEVKAGLRRIAFSSSADAVKLLFCDNGEPSVIESLDLFNVSEIKRPKAGGIEIKFFDRIKALEKLNDISVSGKSDSSLSFYKALENSATSLKDSDLQYRRSKKMQQQGNDSDEV